MAVAPARTAGRRRARSGRAVAPRQAARGRGRQLRGSRCVVRAARASAPAGVRGPVPDRRLHGHRRAPQRRSVARRGQRQGRGRRRGAAHCGRWQRTGQRARPGAAQGARRVLPRPRRRAPRRLQGPHRRRRGGHGRTDARDHRDGARDRDLDHRRRGREHHRRLARRAARLLRVRHLAARRPPRAAGRAHLDAGRALAPARRRRRHDRRPSHSRRGIWTGAVRRSAPGRTSRARWCRSSRPRSSWRPTRSTTARRCSRASAPTGRHSGGLALLFGPEHYDRLLRNARLLRAIGAGVRRRPGRDHPSSCCAATRTTATSTSGPIVYKSAHSIRVQLSDLEDRIGIFTIALGDYLPTGGIRVTVSGWQRVSDNAIPARGKIAGSYVNAAFATEDAHAGGYDDALLLTADGHVAEASAANVFVVFGREVATPPLVDDVLPGITRERHPRDRARCRLRRGRAAHRPIRAVPCRRGVPDRHRRPGGAGRLDRRPTGRRSGDSRSRSTSRPATSTRFAAPTRGTRTGSPPSDRSPSIDDRLTHRAKPGARGPRRRALVRDQRQRASEPRQPDARRRRPSMARQRGGQRRGRCADACRRPRAGAAPRRGCRAGRRTTSTRPAYGPRGEGLDHRRGATAGRLGRADLSRSRGPRQRAPGQRRRLRRRGQRAPAATRASTSPPRFRHRATRIATKPIPTTDPVPRTTSCRPTTAEPGLTPGSRHWKRIFAVAPRWSLRRARVWDSPWPGRWHRRGAGW